MIHVTKKLYKESLKVIYKYCPYKYSMIIICNMTVITITINTMSAVTVQSIIPQY